MKNYDSWYWKIYRLYWNNLTPRKIYYTIKNGFSNVFRWLPVIWNDRDWDQYYLYMLIHKKLEHMEHYHRNYGISADANKIADQIRTCKLLCKRLIDDQYTNPYEKRNDPHREWFSKKFDKAMASEPDENGLIKITDHHEPDEPDGRWILPACKHEEDMYKQDVELLFKIMAKNIRTWWD